MKTIKKILSLLTVAMLLMTVGATVFAADANGSITVSEPSLGQTYTPYKIFDVTAAGDNYAYSIKSTDQWYDTVKAYADVATNGLTLTRVNESTLYNVSFTNAFSAPAFSKKLNEALTAAAEGTFQPTAAAITATEGVEVKWTGLNNGYYFVTTTLGSLCSLTTASPDATIVDKNEGLPFDKTVNTNDVNIGDTVNFTLTSKVPDSTGYTRFDYTITDTMSAGLTFNEDVTVKFGDADITNGTLNYAANGFTLAYDMTKYQDYVGDVITVTYTAKVNENAVIGIEGNPNDAKLVYSSDPGDLTKTKEIKDKEVVYTCKIIIDKYATNNANADDKSKKLKDAEFVLYKEVGGVKKYYQWDDTAKAVVWVDNQAAGKVVITDENGAAEFNGLEADTYYLEEINAPAGYNKLTAPVEVIITRTEAEGNVTISGNIASVANNSGIKLPTTGGIGTTIFYIVGAALVAVAVVLFITRKRMSGKS